MGKSKVLTLFASAQKTATATGTGQNLISSVGAVTGAKEGYFNRAVVNVNMSAFNGTATLDFTLESRNAAGTWFTLNPLTAWTSFTGTVEQSRQYEGPLGEELRGIMTFTSGTPTVTFEATAQVIE